MSTSTAPSFLTDDLPGVGGQIRRAPEDFRVSEIPLYHPCGEGQHTYFRVTKRGVSTFEAARRIAQALGRRESEVYYAGLKDARAITTQSMSVEGVEEEDLRNLQIPALRIHDVTRHTNALKVGHLRGNRFRIVVRGVADGAVRRAESILDVLLRRGIPNYFGSQRFGARLNGHLCGEAMLRRDHERFVKLLVGGPSDLEHNPRIRRARALFDEGDVQGAYDEMPVQQRAEKKALHALLRFEGRAERAYYSIPLRMRQMYASAFQSYLFNEILEERLDRLDRIEAEDLAYLHRNGAVFRVQDRETAQRRCDAFEISPSGPIFGTHTMLPEGVRGEAERESLEIWGLRLEDFALGGGIRLRGSRRTLRVPLKELSFEAEGSDRIVLEFALPSGSFATAVLREVMKTDSTRVLGSQNP